MHSCAWTQAQCTQSCLEKASPSGWNHMGLVPVWMLKFVASNTLRNAAETHHSARNESSTTLFAAKRNCNCKTTQTWFFSRAEKNATLPHCHTSRRDDGSADVQKSPQTNLIAKTHCAKVGDSGISSCCKRLWVRSVQRDLSNQNSTPQSPNPNAFPTKGFLPGYPWLYHGKSAACFVASKIIQKVQLSQRRKTSWQLRPCHLLRMKLLQEAICLSHPSRQKCRTNSLASEYFIAKTYVILI